MLLASSAQPQNNHNNDRQNKNSKCVAHFLAGLPSLTNTIKLTLSNVIEMTMR